MTDFPTMPNEYSGFSASDFSTSDSLTAGFDSLEYIIRTLENQSGLSRPDVVDLFTEWSERKRWGVVVPVMDEHEAEDIQLTFNGLKQHVSERERQTALLF